MSGPSLHAPWREPAAALLERHVGRERVLAAIREGALGFARGARPLPMYVFGPRGSGKTHLVSLAAEGLRAELADAKTELVVVPEDIPALRSADELLARTTPAAARARWLRWGVKSEVAPPGAPRRVVLLEGLDRQLFALGARERKRLRHLLDREPGTWIAGTGIALTAELTKTTEAFYGAFDAWPLEPLTEEEAQTLLDRVSRLTPGAPGWPARRRTLALLAGGSPRALVALGEACRQEPHAPASDRLQAVLDQLTPYYQLRFRARSPQSQRLVEVLADAPRELAPTELAAELGCSVAQISVQAGRLVDDGVLRHRSEGRQSWYRLAESLFRYWLEYRSTLWEETRIASAIRVLESSAAPAAALVDQLGVAQGGRLHPELEAVQEALSRRG